MSSNETIRSSRRLMGFATSFQPEAILAEPMTKIHLGGHVVEYVDARFIQTQLFIDHPIESINYTILSSGVNDINSIVQHAAQHYGKSIAQDELIDIFRQDDTIKIIAQHARLPEKVLRNTVFRNLHGPSDMHSIAFDDQSGALQTTDWYDELTSYYPADGERGCPVALPDAEQRLDPLFVSFSKWASELSIRSLYVMNQQAR